MYVKQRRSMDRLLQIQRSRSRDERYLLKTAPTAVTMYVLIISAFAAAAFGSVPPPSTSLPASSPHHRAADRLFPARALDRSSTVSSLSAVAELDNRLDKDCG